MVVSCFVVCVRFPVARAWTAGWSYDAGTSTATYAGTGTTSFAALVAADVAGSWGKFSQDATGVQVILGAKIVIGDGYNVSQFIDTKKQIYVNFYTYGVDFIKVLNASRFTLGTLTSLVNYQTVDGCSLFMVPNTAATLMYLRAAAGGVINLYDSQLYGYATTSWGLRIESGAAQLHIINCNFDGVMIGSGTNQTIYNLHSVASKCTFYKVNGVFNTIKVTNSPDSVFYWDSYTTPLTVTNVVAKNNTRLMTVYGGNAAGRAYLVNTESDVWTFNWAIGGSALIYRQYEFDLVVLNGNVTDMVENANVTLYKGATKIGTWLTNASGQVDTQTLTYGYYQQSTGDTIQGASDPFYLHIFASGYVNYDSKFYVTSKMALTVSLLDDSEAPTPDPSIYQTISEGDSSAVAVGLVAAVVATLLVLMVFFSRRRV